MIPKMKGSGDSCGTMTSDITTTASPTIPSATPTRPVAIPDYLRKGTGAGSSPRGSPHTPGSSPGGSIGCSPRGSHRRNLHKKTSNGGGSGPSSHSGSPLPNNNNNNKQSVCENGMTKNGAGSTPQTTRKVYSLANASNTDRYSPNGSPRNTNRTTTAATAPPKRIKNEKENVQKNNMINSEDSNDPQQVNIQPEKRIRKSSKGTGEVGTTKRVPRLSNVSKIKDNAVSINPAGASAKGCGNVSATSANEGSNRNNTPIIEPPGLSQSEKLDLLWKNRTIEQGMVKLPINTLDDLIRKESIEKFYIVEDAPVAR